MSTANHQEKSGSSPFEGLLVIDLSRALAGPHAAMMLGDMGARVIKVERPKVGDDSRSWGPPFLGEDDDRESTYFMSCNRNKESITLDLALDEDRDVLRALVRRADVVVENFKVGALARLGLDAESMHEINPRVVILSITGFGHDGPEANRAGYDQIAQGEGGLMSLTGPPGTPTKMGVPIADLLAGIHGAFGVATALHERERNGRGRVVHTSLLASVVAVHAFQGTRWTIGREVPEATGAHHPAIAPYGLFQSQTVPVQIACGNERLWRAFANVVGMDAEEERFATNAQRVAHRGALTSGINARLARHPAEYWLALLDDAGVPAGKVRTLDDVYTWDQVASQHLLIEVEHTTKGKLSLPGSPLRLDDLPHSAARAHHQAPPILGEHNELIRSWLAEPSAL